MESSDHPTMFGRACLCSYGRILTGYIACTECIMFTKRARECDPLPNQLRYIMLACEDSRQSNVFISALLIFLFINGRPHSRCWWHYRLPWWRRNRHRLLIRQNRWQLYLPRGCCYNPISKFHPIFWTCCSNPRWKLHHTMPFSGTVNNTERKALSQFWWLLLHQEAVTEAINRLEVYQTRMQRQSEDTTRHQFCP